MHKNYSRAAVALLVLASTALAGCSHIQKTAAAAKAKVMLSGDEVGAPVGSMKMFPASYVPPEQALKTGSQAAVKGLLAVLEQPVSLTAPITVHTLKSANPELVTKNGFGARVAEEVRVQLAAEGYTISGKAPLEGAPKAQASVRGTYAQAGRTLTVTLEVTDAAESKVLGTQVFTMPIDGALRTMLDR